MAAKRKNGAKGPPNDVYYEDQSLSDQIIILNLRISAMKKMYVDEMEESVKVQQKHIELSHELQESELRLAEKNSERADVLMDYVRQYKTDERETIMKIADLHKAIHGLQEETSKIQKQAEECEAQYDKQIKEKRQETLDISQRMAQMEKEFTAMLADIEQSIQSAQEHS